MLYNSGVILEILKYGHPVLRERGKRISRVAPELRQLAADMIETMHAANGVGLAAQQIGRAIRLTVVDVKDADRPSEIVIDGKPQDVAPLMPMVLVNPVIKHSEGEAVSCEGCLSVPEISAEIRRAARITVEAEGLDGRPIMFEGTGLLSRVVQHEIDHLNGVLFIDRMDAATRASFSGKLKKMQKETQASLDKPAKSSRQLARL